LVLNSDISQVSHERFSYALAAKIGVDEQIVQPESTPAHQTRKRKEIRGVAHRLAVDKREECPRRRCFAKESSVKGLLDCGNRQFLKCRHLPDERQQQRDIGGCSGAYLDFNSVHGQHHRQCSLRMI